MENILTQVIQEIDSLTSEKTTLLDKNGRQKIALTVDLSISERERIASQILKDEQRINEIDLLLQGLQERRVKLESEQKEGILSEIKLRLKKIDLECLQNFIAKWKLIKQVIITQEEFVAINERRLAICSELQAAGDSEGAKGLPPGLNDLNLFFMCFKIEMDFPPEKGIDAALKVMQAAEEEINKEIETK